MTLKEKIEEVKAYIIKKTSETGVAKLTTCDCEYYGWIRCNITPCYSCRERG